MRRRMATARLARLRRTACTGFYLESGAATARFRGASPADSFYRIGFFPLFMSSASPARNSVRVLFDLIDAVDYVE